MIGLLGKDQEKEKRYEKKSKNSPNEVPNDVILSSALLGCTCFFG